MAMKRGSKKPSKAFKRPWEGYDRDCFNVVRALRGMTNSQIAKASDLSYSTVARLRNYETLRPTHRTLVRCAAVVGIKCCFVPVSMNIPEALFTPEEEAKRLETSGLEAIRAKARERERKAKIKAKKDKSIVAGRMAMATKYPIRKSATLRLVG